MIEHNDFLLVAWPETDKFPKIRCFTTNCKNSPQKMRFYQTEWEFITGASIDPTYCEECVAKHLGIPLPEQMGTLEELKCQGYRRRGGAFTLGPVEWEQCDDVPEVMLTIEGKEPMPACKTCWKECIENNLKITKVEPL